MKKKFLEHIFLVFIGVLLLSSCGQLQGEPGRSSPTPDAESKPTSTLATVKPSPTVSKTGVDVQDLNGLQITFMHPWTGSMQSELSNMVDQFNQTNEWGIHVIMNSPGSAGQLEQKVWQGFINRDSANVIAASPSFMMAIDEKKQLVVDLNQYLLLETLGMDTDRVEDFTPLFWNEDVIDGKRLGIPAQRSASVMIYNSTWAKELGFSSPPENFEDFKSQVCTANRSMRKDKDPTNDGIGGMLISNDSLTMLNWLSAFDGYPFKNGFYKFSTSAAEDAFVYLHALLQDSCAWNGKTARPYDYFARRQALVYSGQLQDLTMQDKANQMNGSKDEWMVIAFPGTDGNLVLTSGYSFSVLNENPAKDLAAWLFIRWMSEPAPQLRLLQASGTLPLGKGVIAGMEGYSALVPQWKNALDLQMDLITEPEDADWVVIKPVLEDAGWQLFRTMIKPDQIPGLLIQMDELVKELSERYP